MTDRIVPLDYSGKYVARCSECIRWRGECPVCHGSGKEYRFRSATSLESVGAGAAPVEVPFGPVDE